MSKGIKFKLNRSGVGSLLKSQNVMNVCESYANQIRARAGEGYEVSTYVGKTRVNASVFPATKEARRDNLEHNTLLKARGGGS